LTSISIGVFFFENKSNLIAFEVKLYSFFYRNFNVAFSLKCRFYPIKVMKERIFLYFYALINTVPMRSLMIFACLLIFNLSFAAPDPPPPIPPPVGLPIDNGMTICLAVSVVFGCYKIYGYRRRVEE